MSRISDIGQFKKFNSFFRHQNFIVTNYSLLCGPSQILYLHFVLLVTRLTALQLGETSPCIPTSIPSPLHFTWIAYITLQYKVQNLPVHPT